jgi:hypothetical protein
MKCLWVDTQKSSHKQTQVIFTGRTVLGYRGLPEHIHYNPVESQLGWLRSSYLQRRTVRVVPVDKAAELAGVCSDYQTLAQSLAASKLPRNTVENTAFLGSTCYRENCVAPKFFYLYS